MFEVASYQRAHPDGLRQPGYPGPQTADAAGVEVDAGSRRGRLVERIDQLGIGEVVELDRDPTVGRRLPADRVEETRTHPGGRDEQRAELLLAAVSGEEVEDVGDVRRHVRVRGEEPTSS
jgi:hypothetical protein